MVADGVTNVIFPVAFPTGCASLQITRGVGTASGNIWLPLPVILKLSNTGFSVSLSGIESPGESLVYWFAVG